LDRKKIACDNTIAMITILNGGKEKIVAMTNFQLLNAK